METLQLLQETLNPVAEARRAAEQKLLAQEKQPQFAVKLLSLLETEKNRQIQQLVAVYFKNMVRKYWGDEYDKENSTILSKQERDQIKANLLTLMCHVDPSARPSLSEAIRLISQADFPDNWRNLLPDLRTKLGSAQDFATTIGLLETANTLFKMFRGVVANDEILLKLKYCLENFQAPLLYLYKTCTEMLGKFDKDPEQLKHVFTALRLLTRIFYSLNYLEIPEYFEDHIAEWMQEFEKLLSYENPSLAPDDDEVPGPVELVQAAIIENLNLYVTKYEEVFAPYIKTFTEKTWVLLGKTPNSVRFDPLFVRSVKFLTQLVGNIRLIELFRATLGDFVQRIVVPNLRLREHELENFEDNPMEYIRTDIEGSDSDTRRRSACDLVRGMCKHFEQDTTRLCEGVLGQLINEYKSNPDKNWQHMDTAIALMIAVAAKRYTVQGGVSEMNSNVNVGQFLQEFILPVLQESNVNSRPVVKAGAIKFFSTFRNQMPRETIVSVLPPLVNLAQAQSFVVHTYAASAIERVFMIKELKDYGNGVKKYVFIYGSDELTPILEPAVVNFFAILESREGGLENEYVAKAIMRILARAQNEQVASAAPIVLGKLQNILGKVCECPQNPTFIHYLFESLAVLVRSSCKVNPALVEKFEEQLMPAFNYVLQQDVGELTAYVFQMLAMLLELRTNASPGYLSLFPMLLRPVVWENRGNVPALVRLVEAYMRKAAAETIGAQPQHLEGLLGVFQKLLSMAATADLSFRLLTGMVEFLPTEAYAKHLPTIFQLVLTRLQALGPKISQSVIFFFAVLIGKHGAQPVENALNQINPGIYPQIIREVWVPSSNKIRKSMDRKACIVGMSRVLAESESLQSGDAALHCWANLFLAVLHMFETPAEVSELKTPEEALAELEEAGYSSNFAKLAYAQTEIRDPFAEIPDTKQFFVKALATASAKKPNVFSQLIAATCADKPSCTHAFQSYCSTYGVTIQ